MHSSTSSLAAVAFTLALLALSSSVAADDEVKKARRLAERSAAAKIQGEYAGTIEREGERVGFGVQVRASGTRSFPASAYFGGLPGAGYDGSKRLEFTGSVRPDGVVVFAAGKDTPYYMELKGKRIRVKSKPGSKNVGSLERTVRKSATEGKKPPEGAVVLFDGTSAEHFQTWKGGPAPTEDGLLMVKRGSGGLLTKKPFGSCSLHLEFRLPFEPEHGGQGRANSGCYLQGRYEVQILDSFGLAPADGRCGGIYSSRVPPKFNMSFPPLTWQTFDIDFTEAKFEGGKKVAHARLTVRHNGVLVYEDFEIDHATTAHKYGEGPDRKPLYIQDHGHDIAFRNIWLVEK